MFASRVGQNDCEVSSLGGQLFVRDRPTTDKARSKVPTVPPSELHNAGDLVTHL